ncbi:MAG: hypothetical protein ACOYT8_02400 [Candidatus Dependentiae bacterium]
MKKTVVLLLIFLTQLTQANFIKINNQIENLRKMLHQADTPFSLLETKAIEAKNSLEKYNFVETPDEKIKVLQTVLTILQPIGRSYLMNPITQSSQNIIQCYEYTIEIVRKDQNKLEKTYKPLLLQTQVAYQANETDSESDSSESYESDYSINDIIDPLEKKAIHFYIARFNKQYCSQSLDKK